VTIAAKWSDNPLFPNIFYHLLLSCAFVVSYLLFVGGEIDAIHVLCPLYYQIVVRILIPLSSF